MTEAEAKTKWCPMARVRTGTAQLSAAANRNLSDLDEKARLDRCVGSGCMVWRETNGGGYCGLAGKP